MSDERLEAIRERLEDDPHDGPLDADQFLTSIQLLFSHDYHKDGPLVDCERCNQLVEWMENSHLRLLDRIEAQREVVEAAREVRDRAARIPGENDIVTEYNVRRIDMKRLQEALNGLKGLKSDDGDT